MDPITEKVHEILNTEMGVDSDLLQADNTLTETCDLDSIELVEFALRLEEAFNIEIPDDQITGSVTIGQVVEKIKELKDKEG